MLEKIAKREIEKDPIAFIREQSLLKAAAAAEDISSP